ncbi:MULTISPECIES: CDP-diacylglycerol--serine O-phosphatidyltransferase [Providencia]|uniref:CDP-diacylglycerol--serine O-phosphatidyltransferase n=1 Tax=Providencia rettgeri TaxID=587 RepID=A0AB35L8J9_PRORE|nr:MULTISPECIES: CDP-diacylglycerol--serine O-phosphatidyltransferase [Providencia]AWS50861.1 CDP-diacylglycerol--serine O-phosphatidyltransferase [Providencia rettgeri]EHZ7765115.1 CDP-diacylglycerol--serine O-phosphatidyltransferase [Providencia rettgeri]EIJ7168257.1 CDP-diacylglycerol--serine O-phosphatidyltransferase [Providencia rettgeri]EJD6046347.1 CDP-diacylglycerol--serine O-phosphatidyltransferase [Providencia rettgeri]EJD6377456.1 CDP-diacylglycerol--serine O-phosphatidyltransferase
MLSKLKQAKHQQYLVSLPKLSQEIADVKTLYKTEDFRDELLKQISQAQNTIYITALYLEKDDAGKDVLHALYAAKQANTSLDIKILVDWHRAQRGRIGAAANATNADWYYDVAKHYPEIEIPIYGIPVNTREALGVLHLKGFLFDDTLLYSGASINDVYLQRHNKYRYDRYHLIKNSQLTASMKKFIDDALLQSDAIHLLNTPNRPKTAEFKHLIKQFRLGLRGASYQFSGNASNDELSVTPFVGLGKKNDLNRVITHLMGATNNKLTICTPYFNLPAVLVRVISRLLRDGKQVEIIIGDKTANDFYIPPEEPFKIIGALPYLYEINLRRFVSRLQRFIDSQQLTVRLWKDADNTYHLKGMWVDNHWQLITGNNLNPRAWGLDLENAVLIHDPKQQLQEQRNHELECIRTHTKVVSHFRELDSIQTYPVKVKKLIRRLRRIRVDRLISRIL